MAVRAENDARPETSTVALTGGDTGPERRAVRRWRAALGTTPARIVVHGVLLVLLLVATAVVALRAGAPATNLGKEAATAAARTSTNARQIYVGLANADVAASAVFLSGQRKVAELEGTYRARVHHVEHLLTASTGAAVDDPGRLGWLALISAEFQRYQAMIADALTVVTGDGDAAAQGVLASAYARAASHYMSDHVLTAAQGLWNHDVRLLREARVEAGWWAAAAVGAPLVTLVVLAAVQRWLWRRTHRRLNAGLLVASLCTLAVLGLVVASWRHWPAATDRLPDLKSAVATQSATQQRLGALLAGRADVYLSLGASVDPADHKEKFDRRNLCGDGPDQVDCATLDRVWTARQGREPDAFVDAIDAVQDVGPAGRSFTAAADTLTGRLDEGDRRIAAVVRELPPVPGRFDGLVVWSTLVAGLGVVLGLRRRLVEYR